MQQTVKIQCSSNGYFWVRGRYWNDNDRLRKQTITIHDIFPLVGLSREFEVCNFWGSSDIIRFTITKIEVVKNNFVITVLASQNCPERFYPSIYQIVEKIAEQKNLFFPISYSYAR